MATVWLLPTLQTFTGGKEIVTVRGGTLRRIIEELESQFPGIRDALVDSEAGRIHAGVAVVVDGETSFLGLMERVKADSEVHFIHAISGG